MLRGWRKNLAEASSPAIDPEVELKNLAEAEKATLLIMDDDLEGAEAALGHGDSSYHKLGRGMLGFLRATLGFEKDVIKEASEKLADAEATASNDLRHAQRSSRAFRSKIYAPGTEYSLCLAETQIMLAVMAVLNESLSESIKGFYGLRKAFQTLDAIVAAEVKYEKRRRGIGSAVSTESFNTHHSTRQGSKAGGSGGWLSPESSRPSSAQISQVDLKTPSTFPSSKLSKIETGVAMGDEDDEDEFFDADEDHVETKTENYLGHIEMNGKTKDMSRLSLDERRPQVTPSPLNALEENQGLNHGPESDTFSSPIDVFIHSGANLCFGMLNIMISMIPPAFGRLLFIIGFHGDRARGIRMLWQASKFQNLNGAMSGLIVLGYYNTFIGFSDIVTEYDPTLPEERQTDGYPKQRCEALLLEMRRRHPKSHLWLLEEARLNAFNKRLSEALTLLESSSASKFKQIEAISVFEKALDAMYSHKYSLCSSAFISCLTLNTWSPSLYNYIAGAAQLELYRDYKTTDPKEAKKHAAKATDLFKTAPQQAGKKKFMARQLPFDVFVMRKVKKWEERAQELNCDLVDAIGVSPVEEMIFFWNGYKRMNDTQLSESLARLAWSDSRPEWTSETLDERAVLAVLKAATLRNLGQLDEAEQILQTAVLKHDRAEFKGGLKDDWTCPAAHYEMAVICWNRRGRAADNKQGEEEEKWAKECEGWIEKAAKWESYELDARIGLKISMAQDTLKRRRDRMGKAR